MSEPTEKTGWEELWEERVGAFATAVGKTEAEISEALKGLAGEKGEEVLNILANPEYSPDADLKAALVDNGPKIPLGVFRKNLALLRGPKPKVEETTVTGAVGNYDVLPLVPDDTSFLEALKIGGFLKIVSTDVIAAMKAALANRCGLYDLPSALVKAMEAHAQLINEPCDEAFYKLQKMVTQRSYAEVLSALGVDGHFVTETRKAELIKRLEAGLWESLQGFQVILVGWQDSWMKTSANPVILTTAIASMMSGSQMPNMMQPPDTSGLRDAAEGVIDNINKCFAGTGIPVARALAWEANRIKNVLEEARLPALIGAANREQMLKMLDADVTADYVRLERNIVRYALSIMELPKLTSGQSELVYLGAMLQLGASIPWDKLRNSSDSVKPSGRGSRF